MGEATRSRCSIPRLGRTSLPRCSKDAANEVVDCVLKFGVRAKAYQADVASLEQVDTMVAAVLEDLGPVQILRSRAMMDQVMPMSSVPSRR